MAAATLDEARAEDATALAGPTVETASATRRGQQLEDTFDQSGTTENATAYLARQGWRYDAFLCHTGCDKPFVRLLYDEMRRRGLLPFFDEISLKGGDRVQPVIAVAIDCSPFFVPILSHRFKGQQYPEAEAEAALAYDKQSKKMIPLFYGMTADKCCDSTNYVCRQFSSSTGLERRQENDVEFASVAAEFVSNAIQKQLESNELKIGEPFIVKDGSKDELEALSNLKDWASGKRNESVANAIFPSQLEKHNFRVFCGRQNELENLKAKLWGPNTKPSTAAIPACKVQFISAMGGAGKTTLAAYYARTFRSAYDGGVFAFNAQSSASFHQSVRNSIALLAPEISMKKALLEEDYSRFLGLLKNCGNVLFVFDGCDTLDVISNFLPTESMTVHVIVTTRRRSNHQLLDDPNKVFQLPPLDKDDAVQSVLMWAGRDADLSALSEEELGSAKLLVETSGIQSLPLALRHVGSRMKVEKVSCKQYLKMLNEKKRKIELLVDDMNEFLKYCGLSHLLGRLKEMGYEKVTDLMHEDFKQLADTSGISSMQLQVLETMTNRLKSKSQPAMTWELDIEEVKKKSPVACKVLEIASLLDCKNIPTNVLLQTASPDGIGDADANTDFNEATFVLNGFTLLHQEHEEFSMHSLVQQSVVEAMARDGTLSLRLLELSKCLASMLPTVRFDILHHLNDSIVLSLTPHIYMVASHIVDSRQIDQECWHMFVIACWLSTGYGHFKEAEWLCKKRVEIARTANNQQSELYYETLPSSLMGLGHLYLVMENPTAALVVLQEVMDMRQYLKERDLWIHLKVLDLIGDCYRQLNQFAEAETMLLEEIHILEQNGCPQENELTVAGKNSLATTYQQSGQIPLAIEMFETILPIMRKIQSDVGNVNLSKVLGNLATCYEQDGQLDQAVSCFEEVLTIRRNELPPSHPLLARGLYWLGFAAMNLDQLVEAQQHLTECLRLLQTIYPPGHREIIAAETLLQQIIERQR